MTSSEDNNNYKMFLLCSTCSKVLGPISPKDNSSWTKLAKEHAEASHFGFKNILIPDSFLK